MARSGIGDRVEGIHAVRAALQSGRVQKLIVERRRAEKSEEVAHLVSMARSRGLDVEAVDDVRPMAATTAPQGVVAKCRPMEDHDLRDLVERSTPAALVVVDHVEDTHNLGAIARSAVAAGITSLVVPTRRGAPLGGAAFKAAAGALEHCAIATVSSTADAVKALKGAGVWTVGLDSDGDQSLFGLSLFTEPVAIVVGAETGLGRLVRDRVDVVASIPMAGQTESLNASVAAALACFEVMRVRGTI
jgi:23S rRNA (guanosine2251-2'-O)-methyltransferase